MRFRNARPVSVKIGRLGSEICTISPEYDECRRLAESSGAPLKVIYQAAMAAMVSKEDDER